MEFEELINYCLMLDQEEFMLKGDENEVLVRPSKTANISINGQLYEKVQAVVATREVTTIYYGNDYTEAKFTELREFVVEGYDIPPEEYAYSEELYEEDSE